MLLSRILRYTGVGLFLAVLTAGPFFRGLFFWTELLAAITVISVGFCLWLVGRRLGGLPSGVPGGVAGVALLALLGCYLIQFAWAVFPRGNLDWVLRVAAAWFAYVMMRAEAGPALRRWLGWAFVLSASSVAVVGFMEYTGYFLKDPAMAQSLSMFGLSDRMFTVLQYPNTAAVYFLAAIFAACGLGLAELRAWQLAAASALISLLALACFFTVSRGAVMVFPFGLLLLFIGLERDKRWPALLLLLGAWAPVVVAVQRVGIFSAVHNYASAFRWVAAAMVGGGVAGLVLAYFVRLRRLVQAMVVGAAVVAGVLGLLVLRPGAGLMPKQASRLFDINFTTVNVAIRLIFDRDAAHMVADAPLGRGGWGWERSYRQYQTFSYVARETHNHYAQTAVEAGMPGLITLMVALVASLWAAWRNRTGDVLSWSLAAAAALVAGHSLIDFNLSYGLIWLLLWSLLAASTPPAPLWRWEPAGLSSGLMVGAGTAAMAGLLFGGARYTDKALVLASQNKPDGAAVAAAARQAIRYDRWDSRSLLLIGNVAALEQASRLDPKSAKVHWDLAILLERKQDLRGALREAKLALACQPMLSMHYSKAAALAGTLMVDALHRGDKAEAKALAEELVALGAEFTRRKVEAATDQRLWGVGQPLAMAPDFKLRYGQALYLAGRIQEAESYLKEAATTGLLGSEADLWLYAMYEQRGQKPAMALLEDKPWIRFRSVNPVYKMLKEWT